MAFEYRARRKERSKDPEEKRAEKKKKILFMSIPFQILIFNFMMKESTAPAKRKQEKPLAFYYRSLYILLLLFFTARLVCINFGS